MGLRWLGATATAASAACFGNRSSPVRAMYYTSPTILKRIVGSITHVLLLQDGRIAAAGRKEDVLTDERLSAAFRLHMRVHWENGRPWASVRR